MKYPQIESLGITICLGPPTANEGWVKADALEARLAKGDKVFGGSQMRPAWGYSKESDDTHEALLLITGKIKKDTAEGLLNELVVTLESGGGWLQMFGAGADEILFRAQKFLGRK